MKGSIKEAVLLANQQIKVEFNGNATCGIALSAKEKIENRKKAEEILSTCSKQELIDYILGDMLFY